jgi:hypothetical protein
MAVTDADARGKSVPAHYGRGRRASLRGDRAREHRPMKCSWGLKETIVLCAYDICAADVVNGTSNRGIALSSRSFAILHEPTFQKKKIENSV